MSLDGDPRRRDRMLLVLTAGAGCADALGYLGLGHVFTANMSGNTALLGLHVTQGDGAAALRSLTALLAFGLGLAIGAWIAGQSRGGPWPRAVTRALAVETAILAAFAIASSALGMDRGGLQNHALIALSAIAMGMQSAAVWHLGVPGIATTYLTGTYTSAVTGLVARARSVAPADARERAATSGAGSPPRRGGVRLQLLDLVVYGMGALVGGAVFVRWPAAVGVLPFAAVGMVVAVTTTWQQRQSR